MPDIVSEFDIPGVLLLKSRPYHDDRGMFCETFRESECEKHNIPKFVQENLSISKRGVVRGLHYQLNPKAQGKLVSCVRGEILDIAVDIRKESKTYGKYIHYLLDWVHNEALYIPPGFAHGFMALSDDTCVLYKTTEYYSAAHERAIRWDDPDINIDWSTNIDPIIMSDKDRNAPLLKNAE